MTDTYSYQSFDLHFSPEEDRWDCISYHGQQFDPTAWDVTFDTPEAYGFSVGCTTEKRQGVNGEQIEGNGC
jgi:hypothetical protein